METLLKYKFFMVFLMPLITIFIIIFIIIITTSSIVSNPEIFISNFFSIPFSEEIKYTITSEYGERIDPFTGTGTFHFGIDIALIEGTEIFPSYDGIVYAIGHAETGLGEYIKLIHEVEDEFYMTIYGHLKENSVNVKVGDIVNKNDVIGQSGNTGKSTGPHLHFEIHLLNKDKKLIKRLDPINIFKK